MKRLYIIVLLLLSVVVLTSCNRNRCEYYLNGETYTIADLEEKGLPKQFIDKCNLDQEMLVDDYVADERHYVVLRLNCVKELRTCLECKEVRKSRTVLQIFELKAVVPPNVTRAIIRYYLVK